MGITPYKKINSALKRGVGILFFLPAVSFSADIYASKSADGTPVFSTQPLNSSYSLVIKGASEPPHAIPTGKNSPTSKLEKRRESFDVLIQQTALRHGLEPALVRAIVHVESRFNADALSPKGAVGLMQLMPDTAKRYGASNSNDPAQNLDSGALYFKTLLKRYNGNIALALAAYNAGEGSVDRYAKKVPPFRETMLYVPEVLTQYQAYKQVEGPAVNE